MDKTVILAVAGSGKTAYIIDRIDLESRILIVTYTINNIANLQSRIIARFGYMPPNIHVFTYFSFIYSFCYRPHLHLKLAATGINFEPCKNRFAKDMARYQGSDGRLYSNRIARLLEHSGVTDDVVARLSKYFDQICIDEIQDFAGHDFNFLRNVVKANAHIVFVGDYFQHTFDTSRDGTVNVNLHNDHAKYQEAFRNMGLTLDLTSLEKSHRCSPTICDFVSDSLGINIRSHRADTGRIIVIKDQVAADKIFTDNDIVKLFYQESHKYDCYSKNWGETKGDDKYHDVCVVLNDNTFVKYNNDDLKSLPAKTKNKLYVAITRARNDLYFVPEKLLKKYKGSTRS